MGEKQGLYLGGLCFITDRESSHITCVEMSSLALNAGVRWVQYRDKKSARHRLYCNALTIRRLTRQAGACFIMNDHPDIAVAAEADGVHLGQDDMPIADARKVVGAEMIIGISTHNIQEALQAEAEGADYIGFGPMYHTSTKDAGSPRGLEMLDMVRKSVKIPVVAIGGIDADAVSSVISAGANAVAVAGGILRGDMSVNTKAFVNKLSH